MVDNEGVPDRSLWAVGVGVAATVLAVMRAERLDTKEAFTQAVLVGIGSLVFVWFLSQRRQRRVLGTIFAIFGPILGMLFLAGVI